MSRFSLAGAGGVLLCLLSLSVATLRIARPGLNPLSIAVLIVAAAGATFLVYALFQGVSDSPAGGTGASVGAEEALRISEQRLAAQSEALTDLTARQTG